MCSGASACLIGLVMVKHSRSLSSAVVRLTNLVAWFSVARGAVYTTGRCVTAAPSILIFGRESPAG
eukprot:COSAG02_NODE_75_length_41389_cov_106.665762_43_plen_66_part_00